MQRNRTTRLHVEPLEDRTLMSTCHVTRLSDTGNGKGFRGDLRYCINKVNAEPGADAIDFTVTGIINLISALPSLTSEISIQGPGADVLTVRRSTTEIYRIFDVSAAGDVTIAGITMTNGQAPSSFSGSFGGGISNAGTLVLDACALTRNLSHNYNSGIAAYGGGIYNDGTLTILNSTLSGNEAEAWAGFDGTEAYGGGIYNRGRLDIISSTLSDNSAISTFLAAFGGGIANAQDAILNISNSTIAANHVDSWELAEGGGIFNANSGTLNLHNTLLAANGAEFPSSQVSGPDLYGSIDISRYNLFSVSEGGSGYQVNDILDVDPMLGPLANNGGPTLTMALLPGSPAIDAGDNTDAPDFDQRGPGFPRIVNGTIDIGAFEVQATPIPPAMRPGNELLAVVLTTADWDAID